MLNQHSYVKTSSHLDQLCDLITERIKNRPVEHDGHMWLAEPQDRLAHQLGISTRSLQRLITGSGIIRKRFHHNGRLVTGLRIPPKAEGVPPTVPPLQEIAPAATNDNKMVRGALADAWRPYAKDEKVISDHYRLLSAWYQLVSPYGDAEKILVCALENWTRFTAYAKQLGLEKFLRFRSLSVLVKFRHAAVDLYRDVQQEKMAQYLAQKHLDKVKGQP